MVTSATFRGLCARFHTKIKRVQSASRSPSSASNQMLRARQKLLTRLRLSGPLESFHTHACETAFCYHH